jgi:hypothetical protein
MATGGGRSGNNRSATGRRPGAEIHVDAVARQSSIAWSRPSCVIRSDSDVPVDSVSDAEVNPV